MANEVMNKEMIKQGNVSLVLNSYDDIFSSFDPRGYSEKSLSDDFLNECKKAAKDKSDDFELRLMLEKSKRSVSDEAKIRRRLKEHFQKHFNEKQGEIRKIKNEGFIWVVLGALLIFGIVFGSIKFESIVLQSILTILEVPGWFLLWEGMSKILMESRRLNPEYDFYKKMALSQIIFLSY